MPVIETEQNPKKLKESAEKKADDLINHLIQFQPDFINKLLNGEELNSENFLNTFSKLRKGLIKEFLGE